MKRFDKKGKLIFPFVSKKTKIENEDVLVIDECYCPNGHNLITNKVKFEEFNGILVDVSIGKNKGILGLSPVCGCKSKIAMNIELLDNSLCKMYCPTCHAELPVYAPCSCGGDLITLFGSKDADFKNCIGICNRIGCFNAEIKSGDDLYTCTNINTRYL
jgi:hypothetical protein